MPQLTSDIQEKMKSHPTPRSATQLGGRQVYSFSEDELDGAKKVFLELREMWRGQYFGELSIINKTFRTASVISKTTCRLLVVPKLMFQRLGLDQGEGAEQLLKAQDEQGFTNDRYASASVGLFCHITDLFYYMGWSLLTHTHTTAMRTRRS